MNFIPRYRIYKAGELAAVILFDLITNILFIPAKLIRFFRKKILRFYSQEKIKKIVVFRTDRIGDLVMTLPALKALRLRFPDSAIHLIAGEWNKGILKYIRTIDKTFIWNPSWISRNRRSDSFFSLFKKAISLRKSKYDLAIDFTSDIRINILMWLTGAERRIGYSDSGGAAFLTHIIKEKSLHRVDQNMEPIKALYMNETAPKPVLEGMLEIDNGSENIISKLLSDKRSAVLRRYVIIHPWGGRLIKTWNVDKYAELASRIDSELKCKIILTGGTDDKKICAAITEKGNGKILDTSGRLSLEQTMSLIKRSQLFISPDTGPMHIAVALNVPTITLFGPSDPVKYAPYGDRKRHCIITPRNFECLHCNKIRKPPKRCIRNGVSVCMDAITVEKVFIECRKFIEHS